MSHDKLKALIMAALFAALTCAATMVIQIPSPMSGYVNLGDCFVLLSGWTLGPIYGSLAAAVGSMFADIFSGYAHYAPGTFVIKALVALTACLLYRILSRMLRGHGVIARAISGVAGELVMIAGYFAYASLLLGKGLAAAASIPGNVVQGVLGVASAVLVAELIAKARRLSVL